MRPLSGIVALLGADLVECEVGGIRSGYATKGHRFRAPGEITIGSAADYQDKLRACHVIVDHEEREALIRAVANLVTTWEGGGASVILAWGQVIKGGGTTWGDNTNGTPGQIVKIQATFQVVNGKIQMTSYQYIP